MDHLEIALGDLRLVGFVQHPHVHLTDIAEFGVLLLDRLYDDRSLDHRPDERFHIFTHDADIGRLGPGRRIRKQAADQPEGRCRSRSCPSMPLRFPNRIQPHFTSGLYDR